METGLLSTPPERLGFKPNTNSDMDNPDLRFSEARQAIEEGLHKLETLLNSTVDKNFDLFELYVLRNCLSVPSDLTPWIRLRHYDGLSFSPGANTPSPESIQTLRQQLAESRNVGKQLQAQHNRNEVMLAQLRSLTDANVNTTTTQNFEFLTAAVAEQPFSGQQPLTTNTKFALSQLPALKQMLNQLKSRIVELENAQPRLNGARAEQRQERRQYIEERTRQHIHQASNVGIMKNGPMSGKDVEMDEVEALERVAASFNLP